jgi:predicted metal-dependent peptidase
LLTALLLLQASLFQTWVDNATRDLAIPSITIVESASLSTYAAVNDSTLFVHPLLFDRNPPNDVLRHLAYHEVCHVYLRHYGQVETRKRQHQDEANNCAMTMFFYGKRQNRYYRKWNRWVWEHPFDWNAVRAHPTRRE